MRIAVLCAVFVAGVLVGAVLWPSAGEPAHHPRADATPPQTVAAAAPDRRAGSRDLDAIATEAEAQIEKNVADPERFTTGTGIITGTVRDPAGAPVAGCVITARPDTLPAGLGVSMRAIWQRPHEDADLRDVAERAIESELWRRRARRVATTGADGRFVLERISDLEYRLSAFHDRYSVVPADRLDKCSAGGVLDFVANPVVDVRLEVRLPDGSMAPGAWVNWQRPWQGWAEWYPWVPALNRVRLPVGHATIDVDAWKDGAPFRGEVETDLAADAYETVVVRVNARTVRMLTARLVPPKGIALPEYVEFRARRISDSEKVDEQNLEPAQLPLVGYSTSTSTAVWRNIGSGRHVVAAFGGRLGLVAHAVVEVADGPVEVALKTADPREGPHVVVQVLASDGKPLRDRVDLRAWAGARYVRSRVFQLTAGGWVLAFVGLDYELPGAGRIRATVGEYGSAERSHDLRTPGPLTIRFPEPGRLRVRVDGYDGCGFEGRVLAVLVDEEGIEFRSELQAEGVATVSMQPGEHRLRLAVREGNRVWPILQQRVVLKPGPSEKTIRMPALHSLRIRPPNRWAGRVRLKSEDPAIGLLEREADMDERSGATFDGLAAGAYTITWAGRTIEVRVPAGDVSVE
ncbi:MAG TPA: hypothetical protein VFY93_18375 [Planctomycetota bacterium]|nr:hypothetical protein [Planctomycetota bacterium]